MKVLAIVSAILAVSAAQYALPYSGLGYSGVPWAGYSTGYGAHSYSALPYSAGVHAPHVYSAGAYAPHAYSAGVYAPHAYSAGVYAPHSYAASSQYHAQDELGGYSYGYADGLSTKTEHRDAHGATVGSYSYVDADGKKQTVTYVADAGGFRVSGTNLPVGPKAGGSHSAVGPAPVQDTAEVKAAKAEFQRLYKEAAAAADAAPDHRRKRRGAGPQPVQDTPAVKAAKAQHAYLYKQAAARAAIAPDHGYHGAYPYAVGAYSAGAYPYHSGVYSAGVYPYSAGVYSTGAYPYHAGVYSAGVYNHGVQDTPAVKAAKAEHAYLYNQAAARAAAAPDHGYHGAYSHPYSAGAHSYSAYAPYGVYGGHHAVRKGFSYGFSAPHVVGYAH